MKMQKQTNKQKKTNQTKKTTGRTCKTARKYFQKTIGMNAQMGEA